MLNYLYLRVFCGRCRIMLEGCLEVRSSLVDGSPQAHSHRVSYEGYPRICCICCFRGKWVYVSLFVEGCCWSQEVEVACSLEEYLGLDV